MITFEQAKERVAAELKGTRDVVSGEGWEDATHYLVGITVMPKGDLVDRPAWIVAKRTGRVTRLRVQDNTDRLARMRPVNEVVISINRRRRSRRR